MPTDYSTAEDEAVIAGKPAGRNDKVAAVWAFAHDRAAELHGKDDVPNWFTAVKGDQLISKLEAMPADAPVTDMVKAVEEFLKPPTRVEVKGEAVKSTLSTADGSLAHTEDTKDWK